LIESNWGGTVAEAWMSEGALKQFPEFDQVITSLKQIRSGEANPLQTDPSAMTLFNGMVAPLTPYRIKGVIWYQGESNVDRPGQYRTLFPALIKDWRSHWGYEFPFLFVQLAGFQPNRPDPADYQRAELREAQSMALSVPHTGMATAADIGDAMDVHPKDKQDVAHRLALVAAKTVYGESIVDSGPTYQSMEIEGNEIRIRCSSLGSGLMIKDQYGYLRGFEIAAADGKFVWAQARQDGDSLLVYAENVRQPVAVRYDWMNTPDGNIYNKEGLPALPFRTDAPTKSEHTPSDPKP
jgi:sialate O-acetylesterase